MNAACDLNGYLFCKMPAGALEVEVKVKTMWGKFSIVQDIHTRTEKYCTWEKANGRSTIKTRKRKAPCKMTMMQTEDNMSETDVPTGQGFRYPPQVFTDPTFAGTILQTEEEGEASQESKFLARYCEFCDRCGKSYCWCNSSNWEEGMLNTERSKFNPSMEKTLSPTIRKPPMGWAAYRHKIIKEAEQARPPSPAEEPSTDSSISK